MTTQYFAYYLCTFLAFVPAIVLHEVAHGYVAYRLGDPTAKRAGRLSLNPVKHIDPFGTVLLPALLMLSNMPVFGYAKPVPYNPQYFEDKRKGDLLVGLAGPCANLLMALAGAGIAWLLKDAVYGSLGNNTIFAYFYVYFLQYFTLINLYLMFFNLLPIPPLDGSSIFAFILPEKYLPQYYRVQQYAMPVLLILILVLPSLLHFDPISMYMDVTARNLANAIYPFALS